MEEEVNSLQEQLNIYKDLKCEKESIEKQLAINKIALENVLNQNEELKTQLNDSETQIKNYKVGILFLFSKVLPRQSMSFYFQLLVEQSQMQFQQLEQSTQINLNALRERYLDCIKLRPYFIRPARYEVNRV